LENQRQEQIKTKMIGTNKITIRTTEEDKKQAEQILSEFKPLFLTRIAKDQANGYCFPIDAADDIVEELAEKHEINILLDWDSSNSKEIIIDYLPKVRSITVNFEFSE
jgi:hypothetical protein